MDPASIATAVAGTAAEQLIKRVSAFRAQSKLDRAAVDLWQEILVDVAHAVHDLTEQIGEMQTQLDATETVAFLAQYLAEALSSPTRERRQLLAAALAGTLRPNFSMEMKSRISRVIANLEPSDVVLLRRLPDERLLQAELELITGESRLSVDALITTGCLTETVSGGFGGSGPFYKTTALGREVRAYLEHWAGPENQVSDGAA